MTLDSVDKSDINVLNELIMNHRGSSVAERILSQWNPDSVSRMFTKVFPRDYKRALEKQTGQKK
jgi:glutamate synthase domain-containing protein 3